MNGVNRQVIIVGPRRLQKDLMVCKITCANGVKCQCLEKLELLESVGEQDENGQRLVLIDCQSWPIEDLLKKSSPLSSSLLLALFNMKRDSGFETRAFEAGFKGFFYEDDSAEILTKGIENIFAGDLWVSRKQMVEYLLLGTSYKAQEKKKHTLTRRETEILALVAQGETNESISEKLCVSHHTIRTHVYNIFKKIKVSNRLQASRWADEHLD